MIHVLADGRQYFTPCLVVQVAAEAAVASTCLLIICMHVCVQFTSGRSAATRLLGPGSPPWLVTLTSLWLHLSS